MPTDDGDRHLDRIEDLVREIEAWTDASARAQARALLQATLALHRAGLGRMLERAAADGADPASWAADELVGPMLALHDLHPEDLGTRVERALDRVRPHLAAHGGGVELLGLARGVARLRLNGACRGCPASAATLRGRVEAALYEIAPDLVDVVVEDDGGPLAAAAPGPCVQEVGDAR